jgi:hypothetical protein
MDGSVPLLLSCVDLSFGVAPAPSSQISTMQMRVPTSVLLKVCIVLQFSVIADGKLDFEAYLFASDIGCNYGYSQSYTTF